MNPILWQIVVGILMIIAGGFFQIWMHRYLKRTEQPSDELEQLRRDHDTLEAAFISHTGITINGKSYKTDH